MKKGFVKSFIKIAIFDPSYVKNEIAFQENSPASSKNYHDHSQISQHQLAYY